MEGNNMNKFVVGFAFTEKADSILLVRKLRPEWQKGCLNGIGGKIDNNEMPIDTMNRECEEETGLSLIWQYKGIMKGTNNDGRYFECHIFYAYSQDVLRYKQKEDEILGMYDPLNLDHEVVITNLRFLIPLGMYNDGSTHIQIYY